MNIAHLFILIIAATWLQVSHAQTVAASASDFTRFMAVVAGNTTTVGIGTNGTPVAVAAQAGLPTGAGWTSAGNYGVAKGATAADGLRIAGKGSLPLAAGRTLPITLAGRISPLALVKGFRLITPLGVALTAAPYVFQWMSDAGVQFNPNATGQSDAFLRHQPGACTQAPCNEYRSINMPDAQGSWYSSREDMCVAGAAYVSATHPTYNASFTGDVNLNGCLQLWTFKDGTPVQHYRQAYTVREVAPSNGTLPASMDDIAPYLEATQPDPRVVDEMLKKGAKLDVDQQTVSGPTSVAGPVETSTLADGKQATKSTTYNINCEGDKITVNKTETTNIYNPADGTTATETKTGEQELELPADTPLADVPKLYEQKYPDGVAGVWNTRKAELMATPLGQLASNLMPSFSGAGQCPVWMLSTNVGFADFGEYNVAPPCWIWSAAAVFVVISALLLARALIFGG